jgi:hypothetical protein
MAKADEQKIDPEEIQILVPEPLRSGVYSNTAQMTVSNAEVTLNFIYINPNDNPQGTLVSRVIVTKEHAMQLSEHLKAVLETAKEVNG